jgi:hypothetical protein
MGFPTPCDEVFYPMQSGFYLMQSGFLPHTSNSFTSCFALSVMIYISFYKEYVAFLFQNAVLSTDFGLKSKDGGIFLGMA